MTATAKKPPAETPRQLEIPEPTPYTGPVLDEMPEFIKILYYGEPGSGKTSAACAMARLGPIYLIDAEAGAKARPLRRLGIPTQNIRPITVSGYAALDAFYWRLKQELEDAPPDVVIGAVFDSYTEIHQILLREQVDLRHGKAVRAASDAQGELLYEVEDSEYDVELKQHGIVTEQLRMLTRRFRDLPCHIAFVTLAKRDLDSDTGQVVYLPQLPPKFGTNLRGYVDVIGYTRQADGVETASGFLGIFRDSGKYRGKDRLGGIPRVLANPAFDRVVGCVTETLDLAEDTDQLQYLERGRAAKAAALARQTSG